MDHQMRICSVKVGGFYGWKKCVLCDKYLEDAGMVFLHFEQVHVHESASQPSAALLPESEVPCSSRSLVAAGPSGAGGEVQQPVTGQDNQEASSAATVSIGDQNQIQSPTTTSASIEPLSAAACHPSTSSSSATITGGVLRRATKNDDETSARRDEPYVKPRIMTLSDLRGKGRGGGRGRGRGKYKPDDDYAAEASDSDEDSAPPRKRGRGRGKAAAPKRGASASTRGRGRGAKKSRPARKPNDQQNAESPSNGPVNFPWETNGHVLQPQPANAEVAAVPGSVEDRRRIAAAAAERRLQQGESRGLQDVEAFRLKKQKQEELDRQREELDRRNFGKGSEASLRWQI